MLLAMAVPTHPLGSVATFHDSSIQAAPVSAQTQTQAPQTQATTAQATASSLDDFRYGVYNDTGTANDTLYKVTPTTASKVGTSTNFGLSTSESHPASLAWHGGKLYMTGATAVLYEIDTSAGTATRIGNSTSFGVSETSPAGIASANGSLFMVGGATDKLYTLNTTTGAATEVGALGSAVTDPKSLAAVDIGSAGSPDVQLFTIASANNYLAKMNPSTGTATRAGSTADFGVSETSPVTLHTLADSLLLYGGSTDKLYTLNHSTGGAVELRGLNGVEQKLTAVAESRSTNAAASFGMGEYAFSVPIGTDGTATAPARIGVVSATDPDGDTMSYRFRQVDTGEFRYGFYNDTGTANDALYKVTTSTGAASKAGTAVNFGLSTSELHPASLAWHEGRLYMTGATAVLYTIDFDSGIATRVGNSDGFGVGETEPAGIASANGRLYMVGNATDKLYTLDTATGAATEVGLLGSELNSTKSLVALDIGSGGSSDVQLFTIGITAFNKFLAKIDPSTGTAARRGIGGYFYVGETDPVALYSTGSALQLYGGATDKLYNLEHRTGPNTGRATQVRALTATEQKLAAAADKYTTHPDFAPTSSRFSIDTTTNEFLYTGSEPLPAHTDTLYALVSDGKNPDGTSQGGAATDDDAVPVTIRVENAPPVFPEASYAFGVAPWANGSTRAVPVGTVIADDRDDPPSDVVHSLLGSDASGVFYAITDEVDGQSDSHRALYRITVSYATGTTTPESADAARVGDAADFGVTGGSDISPAGAFMLDGRLLLNDWSGEVLHELDVTDGTAALVSAETGYGVDEHQPSGVAVHNGEVYMIGNETEKLYKLDPATWTATAVHTTNDLSDDSEERYGLISHGGTLYTANYTDDELESIDTTTGQATAIACTVNNPDDDPYGITDTYLSITDFVSDGTNLYASGEDDSALYTVDTATGCATQVGSSTLALSGSDIWALADGYTQPSGYAIGSSTGAITFTGANPAMGTHRLYALATDGKTPDGATESTAATDDATMVSVLVHNRVPAFSPKTYAAVIAQGSDGSSTPVPIATVEAIDTDATRITDTVTYSLRPDDAAGTLYAITGPMNSETGSHRALYRISVSYETDTNTNTTAPDSAIAQRVGDAVDFGVAGGAGLDPSGAFMLDGRLFFNDWEGAVLYEVDLYDGTAAKVSTVTGYGVGEHQPTGVTVHNGEVYMIGNETEKLYTLDPTTWTAAPVHATNDLSDDSEERYGLASHGGTLYTANYTTDQLESIDTDTASSTAGQATPIACDTDGYGVAHVSISDLVSDGTDLYASSESSDKIYTLDTDTASSTAGCAAEVGEDSDGLALSGSDIQGLAGGYIRPSGYAIGTSSGAITYTGASAPAGVHRLYAEAADGRDLLGAAQTTPTPDSAAPVTVTVAETPAAVLELLPSAIAEDGGAAGRAIIRAKLTAPSVAPTTVTLTATPVPPAASNDFTLSGTVLTIPAGSTLSTGTRTVTATDDTTTEADKAITISAAVANTSTLGVTPPASRTLTILEDDLYEVTPSQTELAVPEGGTAAYTIALSERPAANVVITLAKAAGGDTDITFDTDTGTLGDQNTLTFTVGNWNTAQTVTVAAVEDDRWHAGTATIRHTVTSGDSHYNGVTVADVTAVESENETGVRVSPTSLEVPEGSSATYTLTMTQAPTADVRLASALSTTQHAEFTYTPTLITFTPSNWNTARTVTVSAAEDDSNQIHGTATMTHTIISGTHNYFGVTVDSVSVAEIDDDITRKQVTLALTPAAIPENGGSTAVTASLSVSSTAVTVLKVRVTPGTGASERDFIQTGDTLTCAAGGTTCTGTVTIAAVDNGYDTADKTFTVTGTAANTAETDGVEVVDAALTITDDETAGVTAQGATFTEPASTARHDAQFRLNSRPAAALTVTPTLASGSDAGFSVGPSTGLTINPTGDWTAAQPYTVTLTPDADAIDGTATIDFTISDTTDAVYSSLSIPSAVFTEDDEDAAFTFSPSSPSKVTAVEGGTEQQYTMRLAALPASSVTVSIAPAAASDESVSVTPSSLTFTTADYATAQTVYVIAAEDGDHTNDRAVITHTVAIGDGPPAYADVTGDVTVIAIDNDLSLVTLTLTPSTIAENGGVSTVTATLDEAVDTATSITVSAASEPPGSASGVTLSSNTTLTIPASSTASTGTVTITATDDSVDTADKKVTVSGTTASTAVNAPIAQTLTITNDDTAGVQLSRTAMSVGEGASAVYTVKLTSEPASPVTVVPSLSPSDAHVTVSPSSGLVFGSSDWNTAKTVTVTVADDDDVFESDATIVHAVTSADAAYSSFSVPDVTVTKTELPSVHASASEAAIPEGSSATYTLRLNLAPTADVTVTLKTSGDSDITVDTDTGTGGNQNTLTFTAGDWNTAQTVTVTAAADDDAVAGATTVVHDLSSTGDDSYNRTGQTPVSLIEADDDTAGLSVAPPSRSILAVEGGTGSYTLRLDTQPTAAVSVAVAKTTGSDGDITVDTDPDTTGDQSTLTFTTADWNTAQTVTVTADTDADSAAGSAVITNTTSSSDYYYNGLDVTVTAVEADTTAASVAISATALNVPEGGSLAYSVLLTTAPTADVTVTVSRSGSVDDDITVDTDPNTDGNQNTLTFTTGDWNTAQTVTVSADDDIDSTDGTAVLSHTATSTDTDYGGITIPSIAVSEADDDKAGLVLSPASLPVAEGSSNRYLIRLAAQPTDSVKISLSRTGDDDITPTAADCDTDTAGIQLCFTATDWNTTQPITVTAASDTDRAAGTAVITHTATSTDTDYDNAALPSLTATEIDTTQTSSQTPSPPLPQQTPPLTTHTVFTDIAGNTHEANILKIAAAGITEGCAVRLYCPNRPVTRAQMASFLTRALKLPTAAASSFQDITGNTHEANIRALAATGITEGCTTTTYCPNRPVTRAQMASFLTRALKLPTAAASSFQDIAGNTHEANIRALAATGITEGCTPTTYCPNRPVTRAQMASFLTRALKL